MQLPESAAQQQQQQAVRCESCGTDIAPSFLSCPVCQRLVHAERLKQLAAEAERFREAGEIRSALQAWRDALELLPQSSRQFAAVSAKISELTLELDKQPAAKKTSGSGWVKGAAAAGGAFALLAWKLKALLLLLLTKGKLLLLGLSKSTTLFSMLLSLGVYWAAWGWKFAAGLIAAMYVHEMGHVAMLRHYGVRATAPMFVPGLGAFVRMKQNLHDPRAEARIGLAGPTWGLAASAVCALISVVTGWASFAAMARVGGWLNLFNLMPVWQLDGGRGFQALSRAQRWAVTLAVGIMFAVTREGLLVLILILSAARALGRDAGTSDRWVLAQFVALVVALSMLLLLPVNLEAGP